MAGYACGAYLLRHWIPIYFEPGWMSLFCLVCLLGGAILVSLGIIGEYVGRIYEQIKGRPLYIVATRAGQTSARGMNSATASLEEYRRSA
jgi:dolichol-phosphate mannosyltransferase